MKKSPSKGMGKANTKEIVREERRKRPRTRRAPAAAKRTARSVPSASTDSTQACRHCSRDLSGGEKALFVEEEVGRVFCSEKCITEYFAPEIDRLEKEYLRLVAPSDLSASERESMAHLRWITLQEPDEIWRQKTLAGDYRYTLISQFQPGNRKVWSICITLFLRGEPSFLYLAFPTANEALVNHYRRGERAEWARPDGNQQTRVVGPNEAIDALAEQQAVDRLADSWTEDETFRAEMIKERKSDDIPPEEFHLYTDHLEQSLEEPDEVWSVQPGGDESPRLYHFIRRYQNETPNVWYVIVARETEDEEQIEILDAFPTRDPQLVQRYRQGSQEVGGQRAATQQSRVVH